MPPRWGLYRSEEVWAGIHMALRWSCVAGRQVLDKFI